ncbi:hypothetical protein PFLUV_G00212860 [Perca fluviatilis]|uniref:Uncharacterized protein n=1 Tax=Perca fluviatilis TaxID=8168 RepID=A0A6A5DSU5_PERFL|nr:hypothetical protein PFLUV_G00212860 [Perca fluviatilis]
MDELQIHMELLGDDHQRSLTEHTAASSKQGELATGRIETGGKSRKHEGHEEQEAKTPEIPDPVCFWITAPQRIYNGSAPKDPLHPWNPSVQFGTQDWLDICDPDPRYFSTCFFWLPGFD